MVALVIGHQAGQTGEKRTAGDGGDDPRGPAFGVAAQTADGQREDGGEDARLEEEDQHQHGDAALAPSTHRRGDEDHDARHEHHQHPAWLHEHHQPRGGEPADGKQALANGVPIGAGGVADVGRLDAVLDELAGDPDLSADVAELRGHAEEELVLLAQRAIDEARQAGRLLGLQRHVGVGDLGDGREEEDDGEEEDEGGDAEVGPLDVAEVGGVGVLEEDARRQQRGHDGPDGLEGLAELEPELGQPRGAAGRDERVRARLQRRQARPDDEQRAAEPPEGAVHGRGPEHERADAVDGQARDEGPAVPELTYHPAGVRRRADQVRPEVGPLQPARFRRRDVERVLEFGVQHVQQPVREPPEEEEHRHERDGDDGLPHRERRRPGEPFVGDGFPVLLCDGLGVGGTALVEDLCDGRFFFGEETHDGVGWDR